MTDPSDWKCRQGRGSEPEPAHQWNWVDFVLGALVLLAVGGIAGSMVYGRFA